MSNSRKYWNSLEQYQGDPSFIAKAENEFNTDLPVEDFLGKSDLDKTTTSRRDFLKFVGFTVAAATVASCETPVIKSIPYVVRPEEIIPGVANYYASTYFDGFDFASVLVKTREGRPIFIEGNKLFDSGCGVNARVNSSVLSLYDSSRLMYPLLDQEQTDWRTLDSAVSSKLNAVRQRGGKVRLLSNTIISPSTKAAIDNLQTSLSADGTAVDFEHIQYDPYSSSGLLEANKAMFGKSMLPNYRFDEAKVIVSIGADFLGSWMGALGYESQYAKRRIPSGEWMNKHYQFEGTLTLTGSNADVRAAIRPSEAGLVVIALYNEIAKKAGRSPLKGSQFEDDNNVSDKLKQAADELWQHKAAGLVVCGSNDPNIQLIVNGINEMIASYGHTIDTSTSVHVRQGNDADVASLAAELNSGSVDVLMIYGVNPAYTSPASWKLADGIKKAKFSVYFGDRADETGSLCNAVAVDNHYLESWNDFNPRGNHYSLSQPTISPLFDSRQAQESLLVWAGFEGTYYDFMKKNWETSMFPGQMKYSSFDAFWNSIVHDGVYEKPGSGEEMVSLLEEVEAATVDMSSTATQVVKASKSSEWDVELCIESSIGVGNQANNPWLQELPHPISRVTWDNYIAMNPNDMEGKYNIKLAEQTPATVANLTVGGQSYELPVVPVPGQKRGTVSVALGYGRTKAGKVVEQGDQRVGEESTIGLNVFPSATFKNGALNYILTGATIEPTEKEYPIASTQTHHTMMGRKIVNETSLKTFKENGKDVWNPDHVLLDAFGKPKHVNKLDLWGEHDIALGHRWGMSIDLNTCTGCGACVTACHAENNVPVVGKDEVRRTRTMSWLRVDRYFSSDMNKIKGKEEGVGKIDMYAQMEKPSDYPEVVFQPIMCQHCNHAPCETVCPVAATTHSNEGLNQMTYNRCIGTRYCANNCPYKVRRFNWFSYINDSKFAGINPSQDDIGRMVLNPDVVVRSRGVMEKCSFCVQSIQAAKLAAKKAGRPVKDGEVNCACASACPTNAISFGDLNDPTTEVAQLAEDDRAYNLLEEIGARPNVWYQTKVRNLDEERVHEAVAGHGGGHHEGEHGGDGHGDGHGGDHGGGGHEEHHGEHGH